jgi:hypothetical protein
MSELLPEGTYAFVVEKAEKDILSDGREILYVTLLFRENGKEHRVYDVIQTQEKLDTFLVSIGYPPGSMKLGKIQCA